MVVNGTFALLLAGVLLLGYEKYALQEWTGSELGIQAGIVADSSAAPLSFSDERAAKDTLSALRSDPNLAEAAIYDSDNRLFAWYARSTPHPEGQDRNASASPPAEPRRPGLYSRNGSLLVWKPILLRGQRIGTVLLKRSMNEADSRLRRYAAIVGFVTLASLIQSILIGARLLRTITAPIAELSHLARLVSVEKDYSVRASRQAGDEVGFLVDSFNEMLTQIENHDRARRGAEASLRESEERFALAARGANDGLWDWKPSIRFMYLSPRGNQMLGYPETPRFRTHEEWEQQIHAADRDRVHSEWLAVNQRMKEDLVMEYRMRRTDGTYIWVLVRGKAVSNEDGLVVRIAGSLTDITAGKIADPLTGLPNRLYFLDRLENAIQRDRDAAAPFAVLFVDLDRFKLVNDNLGHAVGDEFLVEIARRLESGVASFWGQHEEQGPIIVARVGGDEFAVLQGGVRGREDAIQLAKRVLDRLGAPIQIGNRQMFCSGSIGIALSSSAETPEDLLRNADTAMYHAKAAGRSRFEVFDEEMRERAIARLEIEAELRKAIDGDQMVLFYQPQVSIPGCRITGYEALVRWQHPKRGLILPSEFIPVAEETGLIIPLGQWVLNEACRQMAEWQKKFIFEPPLTMSVNVSFKQLRGAGFADEVKRILAQSGLRADCLRLEMTESSVMTNAEEAIHTLMRLKELNVALEIDDFGTGYSSLSYLSRLPFDTVKIDCSFVEKLGSDSESSEIVRAILELARSMSMNVVAEGVETSEQLDILNLLGCSHAPGYLFSKPIDGRAATVLFEVEAFKRSLGKIGRNMHSHDPRWDGLLRHSREDAVLVTDG